MPDPESLFDARHVISVNDRPIQHPARDRLLRSVVVGGPDLPGDRRVFLSADLLGRCLDVARSAATGRAMLTHAGVRVDVYARADGHTYEVWTLTGYGPQPEPLPDVIASLVGGGAR